MLEDVFVQAADGKIAAFIGFITVGWMLLKRRGRPTNLRNFCLGTFIHASALYIYAVLIGASIAKDGLFELVVTNGFGESEIRIALFISAIEAAIGLERTISGRSPV